MMMPTSGFIAKYYLRAPGASRRSFKQGAQCTEQLAGRAVTAARIDAGIGRLVYQRLQRFAIHARVPSRQCIERGRTFGEQASSPGFDALVPLGVIGRAARLCTERSLDRSCVYVAHEL